MLSYVRIEAPEVNNPLNEESGEARSAAANILAFRNRPYSEMVVEKWDGSKRIGTSLELREDFYSLAYISCMK